MAEHFETRHRELTAAADANADDGKGWDQWTTPSESRLRTFEERTGPLVDDLVVAAREVMRFYAEAGVRFASGHPEGAMFAKLVALDEASRG